MTEAVFTVRVRPPGPAQSALTFHDAHRSFLKAQAALRRCELATGPESEEAVCGAQMKLQDALEGLMDFPAQGLGEVTDKIGAIAKAWDVLSVRSRHMTSLFADVERLGTMMSAPTVPNVGSSECVVGPIAERLARLLVTEDALDEAASKAASVDEVCDRARLNLVAGLRAHLEAEASLHVSRSPAGAALQIMLARADAHDLRDAAGSQSGSKRLVDAKYERLERYLTSAIRFIEASMGSAPQRVRDYYLHPALDPFLDLEAIEPRAS